MTDPRQICRLPQLCGADIEFGNFILSNEPHADSGQLAARALLAEIPGVSRAGSSYLDPYRSQDWGRKYLLQGGCAYIDLDHLELALPECLSAFDHVAAWHALLRTAQDALAKANAGRPDGFRIQVIANNSDGHGHSSYGSHLNFLVTRKAYDDIFARKIHPMLLLAAYQASSIVFAGAGKTGSENGAPPVGYQLSQRADFIETLVGPQTTYRRPLVNSRDEPLTGQAGKDSLARLHVIYADNTLCHGSSLLKVGVYQLLLAQLEAGCLDYSLILDDPVEALRTWSHDPSLQARCRTADGRQLTAVEHQLLFLERAAAFAEHCGYEGSVPRAGVILSLWEDTLSKLQSGDLSKLTGRLDWVLKLFAVERALDMDSKLDWSSPQIKHLDHIYASLDPAEGLYWQYARAGLVESFVSEDHIASFVRNAPTNTRAWTRAMLLRCALKLDLKLEDIDWDQIQIRIPVSDGTSLVRTVELGNPLRFTRDQVEPLFRRAHTFTELLDLLETLDTQTELADSRR